MSEKTLALTTASATLNLGFLTVLHETSAGLPGYQGGYLVTNDWGRPLEFRLSTAVQPNRVQQILYGGTLEPFICAELIGKTLVEKTATAVQLVFTDRESVLDLRARLEAPVAWLAPVNDPSANALAASGAEIRPARAGTGPILCHPRFPGDVFTVREMLERLDGTLDLSEPFTRIREALGEARKAGVSANPRLAARGL